MLKNIMIFGVIIGFLLTGCFGDKKDKKLSTPSNIQVVEQSKTSLLISWNQVKDARDYSIFKSDTKDGEFQEIANVDGLQFLDENDIISGKEYFYKVRANGKKSSDLSGAVKGVIEALSLDAPQDVLAVAMSSTKIKITWSMVENAEEYGVYKKNENDEYERINVVKSTFYENDNLSEETTYLYKIKAISDEVESDFSEVVSAKTPKEGSEGPIKPVVSGVVNNGKYKYVSIKVNKEKDTVYEAKIDGGLYIFEQEYSVEGSHTLVVTATKNGKEAKTTINFEIEKEYNGPDQPVIVNLNEGDEVEKISVNVLKVDGTDYSATIDGKTYIIGENYEVVGSHTLVVTATKNGEEKQTTINFKIIKEFELLAPVVTGVEEGKTYTKEITIDVVVVAGVENTAKINGKTFTLGSKYSTNGNHKLVVEAKKDGLSKTTTINFTIDIDNEELEAPVVKGVEEGKTYNESVTISVEEINDITYTATIDGKAYTLGTEYKENGDHTVKVTAKKGVKTAITIVKFKVDIEPEKLENPEITGVENGKTYKEEVTINVSRQTDVAYTAIMNGKAFIISNSGTKFSENGTHTLIVNAIKGSLTAKTTISFTIDIVVEGPEKPTVTGVENNGVYTSGIEIDVVKKSEETYKATIDNKNFELGSEYSTDGLHTLVVTATKNGKTETTTIKFTIDTKALEAPENLKIVSYNKSEILLKWDPVKYDFDGYRLIKKNSFDDAGEVAYEGIYNSFTDKTLVENEVYIYVVKTYKGTKESLVSNIAGRKILGTEYTKLFEDKTKHTKSIIKTIVLNNSKKVITASDDRQVVIWDISNSEDIKIENEFEIQESGVFDIDVNSNESKIVISDKSGNIKIYNISSQKLEKSLKIENSMENKVSFSLDGSKIGAGGSDGIVRLINSTTGLIIKENQSHGNNISDVSYKNTGNLLITVGSDKKINVWNTETEKTVLSVTYSDVILSVSDIKDDKIAFGSYDNKINIIDINKKEIIKTIETHGDYISSLVFSSNNNLLFSSSLDSIIKVTDIETGLEALSIVGEIGLPINNVSVNSDDSYIVVSQGYSLIIYSK